jgi:hypothetical protein
MQAGRHNRAEEDITMSIRRHQGGERYRLELEALAGDDAPPVVRLRSALKCLLRSFRLRCRRVEALPPRPRRQHRAWGEGGQGGGPGERIPLPGRLTT